MSAIYAALRMAIDAEEPVVIATIVRGAQGVGAKLFVRQSGATIGSLAPYLDDQAVIGDALEMLAQAKSGIRTYPTPAGPVEVFVESYPPPPTMYIVGAVHIAIPLVTFAKALGFRVIVIDARGIFATPERFAHADELIVGWPDEVLRGRLNSNSYVVLLTHDPKLDDPALKIALPSPARYVGALGSPSTHAKRLARLREAGMCEEQLARLHAPIGLTIGATTPEEIAVSIIAEVVAARHGLTKRP